MNITKSEIFKKAHRNAKVHMAGKHPLFGAYRLAFAYFLSAAYGHIRFEKEQAATPKRTEVPYTYSKRAAQLDSWLGNEFRADHEYTDNGWERV